MREFLEATSEDRLGALWFLAITTGMRKGEILGLRWKDFNEESGSIMIQRQLQRIRNKGLVFCPVKSSSSKRRIVVGEKTISRLKEHKRRQKSQKKVMGDRWQENNLIFPSSIGTPMGPRNLLRAFKKRVTKANLPEIRFHDLRHTAASLMLLDNLHPKYVSELLGHSDIVITLQLYSHILPTLQQRSARRIEDFVTKCESQAKDDTIPETNEEAGADSRVKSDPIAAKLQRNHGS